MNSEDTFQAAQKQTIIQISGWVSSRKHAYIILTPLNPTFM